MMATMARQAPRKAQIPNVYLKQRRDTRYIAVVNVSTTDAKFHYGPVKTRAVAKTLEACQWRDEDRSSIQACTKTDQLVILKQQDRNKVRFMEQEVADLFLTKLQEAALVAPHGTPDSTIFAEVYQGLFGSSLRDLGTKDRVHVERIALLRRLGEYGVDTADLLRRRPGITKKELRYFVLHPEEAVDVVGMTDGVVVGRAELNEVTTLDSLRSGARSLRKPADEGAGLADARVEYGRLAQGMGVATMVPPTWDEARVRAEIRTLQAEQIKAIREASAPPPDDEADGVSGE